MDNGREGQPNQCGDDAIIIPSKLLDQENPSVNAQDGDSRRYRQYEDDDEERDARDVLGCVNHREFWIYRGPAWTTRASSQRDAITVARAGRTRIYKRSLSLIGVQTNKPRHTCVGGGGREEASLSRRATFLQEPGEEWGPTSSQSFQRSAGETMATSDSCCVGVSLWCVGLAWSTRGFALQGAC